MLPIWLILAILTGFGSNAFNFATRYILKNDEDSTVFAWYFELIRFIVFIAIAIFDWHLVINLKSIILFSLLGLTEFISTYWYMKMHSYTQLSVSTILSRTRMIWIPILSFFLISESLKSFDYIGIAVTFLGVSLISAPKKLFIDKGAFYANASAFIIAINVIITVMLFSYGSNSLILAACSFPSIILFPLLMKNTKKRIRTFFKKRVFIKTLTMLINICASLLFLFALRFGEASKVNAVYQGMLIISVITGIIFLKERQDITRKLIGASITVVGVVLLSFS